MKAEPLYLKSYPLTSTSRILGAHTKDNPLEPLPPPIPGEPLKGGGGAFEIHNARLDAV